MLQAVIKNSVRFETSEDDIIRVALAFGGFKRRYTIPYCAPVEAADAQFPISIELLCEDGVADEVAVQLRRMIGEGGYAPAVLEDGSYFPGLVDVVRNIGDARWSTVEILGSRGLVAAVAAFLEGMGFEFLRRWAPTLREGMRAA